MSDQIIGGATLWARHTIESEIFLNKPDKWFKIWFYLANRVNYKDTKHYKRGECFLDYKKIMDKIGCTKGVVDHFFRWAKSRDMIRTRKATRGMYVEIVSYNRYQTLDNYYIDVKSDTESTVHATTTRQTRDTIVEERDNNKKYISKDIYKENFKSQKPIISNNCETEYKDNCENCSEEITPPSSVPPPPKNKFDEFYKLYPRKVGKGNAVKAWKKIKNPDEVIAGLKAQLFSLSQLETQFIPHPASWLNADRWEDEVDKTHLLQHDGNNGMIRELYEMMLEDMESDMIPIEFKQKYKTPLNTTMRIKWIYAITNLTGDEKLAETYYKKYNQADLIL